MSEADLLRTTREVPEELTASVALLLRTPSFAKGFNPDCDDGTVGVMLILVGLDSISGV